jgi:hypothetical protein
VACTERHEFELGLQANVPVHIILHYQSGRYALLDNPEGDMLVHSCA